MDDIADAGTVVQWIDWGNPYHGSIVNATLTIDGGGGTRTVPATTTNDCFLFRVPGAPGGVGDTAPPAGAWRDYLLLYGKGKAVYEKAISTADVNWLFCRADGTRWLIRITSSTSGITLSGASLAINFSATRFGDIVDAASASPEVVNFTLTLADRGLDTSTVDAAVGEYFASSVSIGISDITPRGDKCCLMFYTTETGTENNNQRFPYAFFEVVMDDSSITNFSTCSIAMVYDIADVAGSRADDLYQYVQDTPPPLPFCDDVGYHQVIDGTGFTVTDSIIAAWYDELDALFPVHFNYDEPFVAGSGVIVGGSYPPDCYGYAPYDTLWTDHSEWSATIGATAFGVHSMAFQLDWVVEGEIYSLGPGSWDHTTLDINLVDGDSNTLFAASYASDGNGSALSIQGSLNTRFTSWLSFSDPSTQIHHACFFGTAGMYPWALVESPVLMDLDVSGSIPELNNAPFPFVKRFSSTLIGIGRTWVDKDSEERITHIDKFLTKSGFVDNTYSVPVDITLGNISASIQPVTLEIAIGSDGLYRSFV